MHYEKFQDGSVKCVEDEIPFEIPQGWEWTRLGIIGNWGAGTTPNRNNPDYYNGTIPWLKTGDLNDDYITEIPESISDLALKETSVRLNPAGSVLIAMYGATIGKLGILTFPATTNQACCACITFDNIEQKYLFFFLLSQRDSFIYRGVGGAQPNISKEKIISTLFPLPPYSEQCRIAFMLDNISSQVNNISIGKDEIVSTIVSLKKKILDLAIRGKLVPQDPSDEPASVLLERIRAEKEELIKQGKIKRNKKGSVIFKGEDNSYYETVPTNWEEVSLSAIAEIELGKTLDSVKNTGEMFPYLRSVNIQWNDTDLSDIKKMRFESDEIERYSVKKGDLLICEGGDVGRCSVWKKEGSIFYQNALHRVRFYGDCSAQFFVYTMLYLESIGYLKRISNGVTIKHLTKNILTNIPFLLPPIAGQHRIVCAIETYFSTLDKISTSLS